VRRRHHKLHSPSSWHHSREKYAFAEQTHSANKTSRDVSGFLIVSFRFRTILLHRFEFSVFLRPIIFLYHAAGPATCSSDPWPRNAECQLRSSPTTRHRISSCGLQGRCSLHGLALGVLSRAALKLQPLQCGHSPSTHGCLSLLSSPSGNREALDKVGFASSTRPPSVYTAWF